MAQSVFLGRAERHGALLTILAKAILLVTLSSPVLFAQGRSEFKLYISADMEGVAGVVTDQQLWPGGFEYDRFREFMTAEVNACIEGARAAGATKFVVSDSHGNGQNLLVEKLPADVTIIRAGPRPLAMMEGIDDSFDGAIFLGYHASTASSTGVRAHTMSSQNLTDVRLNGKSVSEGAMNAALAGDFGVPVILISGDDAAVAEVQATVGEIEGAVVKWAKGFHSAQTLTPDAARDVIRKKTMSAVEQIDEFETYRLQSPIVLDLSFKNYRPAELLAYLPSVERVDSRTIRFVGSDLIEVYRFLRVALEYRADLQP